MSDNEERISFTKAELRQRVLSDEHFEFRDGETAANGAQALGCTQPVFRGRQARLRPEYGHIYPYLTADIWEPAAVVVDKVIAEQVQQRRRLVVRNW